MASAEQVVAPVKHEEEKQYAKGLHVLGYVIPWWVVVVVIALAVYLAYEQGYLEKFVGKPRTVSIPASSAPMTGGALTLETPEQVRYLFKGDW